jgi:hypothetical protein
MSRKAALPLLILAAATVASVLSLQPPSPRPASAPADVFSGQRAYAHVQQIGREVHVTGSPAADAVRQYIVDTLTKDGLSPEIQDTVGVNAGKFGDGIMARVRNVVVKLPGQNPTGRLILMAHYDSVQVSYGANDDGAGVSTMLEVARALTAEARPRNDVIFVFTDAEEACLCGAEAFVNQHPLAKDPAVVLNLESRGSSGPAVMFQTSDGNSGVVGVYGRVAPHPVATSVAVEVYRLLSNDTDFTPVLNAKRFTGLNAAYIDGSTAYHSPLDRPSNVDVGSLQHHGDNALALAREFGRVDLGPLMHPSASDATYFPLPGGLLFRYPGRLNWPVAVLALLAVAAFGWLARRRGLTSVPRLSAGVGLALLPVIGAAVLAQVFWALLVLARPGYGELIDPHRPLWFRLAVAGFTLLAVFLWYGLSRRKVGPVSLAAGALALFALLGILFAALIPGGSYLTALPALFGALAGIGGLLVNPSGTRLVLLTVGGAVGVVVLTPAVTLFFPALGLALGAAPAVFAALLALSLLPAFELLWRPPDADRARLRGSTPAVVALGLAVILTGIGLGVDRWDARYPLPTNLMYALDEDTGTARWVSLESSPGEWTRQFVHGHANLSKDFPVLPAGQLSVGPAAVANLAAPTATVESSTVAGDQRTVKLTVKAGRPVRLISFYGPVGDTRVVKATVAGRDAVVRVAELNRFGVVFNGPQDGTVEVTLVLRGSDQYPLRVIDGSDGLDALPGWKPRPSNVGVIGSHSSELLAVGKTYSI